MDLALEMEMKCIPAHLSRCEAETERVYGGSSRGGGTGLSAPVCVVHRLG